MKKTLMPRIARIGAAPRAARASFPFVARLTSAVALLGLIATVGLFASRPAHSGGGPVPVAVSNLPLPTTPTDQAAPRQPFQASTTYVIQDGSSYGSLDTADGNTDISVPAGKRLVIQTVSVSSNATANGQRVQSYIAPTVNRDQEIYALPSVLNDVTGAPGATLSATLYADPLLPRSQRHLRPGD